VALRAAVDAHVVVIEPGTDRYRLRHALLAEVAYDELLPPQRSRLHARVATALEAQPQRSLGRADLAGELAFHLDRSGDEDAAFRASLIAADAAAPVAPAAALSHLERALELWPPDHDQGERARRMWEAAEFASGVQGNARGAELARVAFDVGLPPQGEAWAHERLARYLVSSGQLDAGRAQYQAAAALLTGPDDPGAAGVYTGLAQDDVMSGRDEHAEAWCRKVFEIVPDAQSDALAWTVASRVLGLIASNRGHPATAVDLCRRSVAAAPSAQAKGLATLYLGVVLLDAGRNQEALDVAGDGAAEGHRAGIDRSFGGYMDAIAAEALARLGRTAEADAVIARHDGDAVLPVGAVRVARIAGILAARRGEADRARALVAWAEAQSTDAFHRAVGRFGAAETHLVLGDWAAAGAASRRALDGLAGESPLWQARFAHLAVDAAVEAALDARATGASSGMAPPEVQDVLAALVPLASMSGAPDIAAHVAHASASMTRLDTPDADAWARAADAWDELGDRWWCAAARLREGEAAALAGSAARAGDALRDAYAAAAAMGAKALVADVESVARRARISLEAPAPVDVGAGLLNQFGLTPREAEVLALVGAGLTNRQIGEELFVSEKTASVHVSNILRKMGAATRVDAAAMAERWERP
jgi:DNA-binding CsgD family transcriptional regulator